MARFYADEDFAEPIVRELQRLGHEVDSVIWSGRRQSADLRVLQDATTDQRIVLTFNRRDYHRLHQANPNHAGIVSCTRDNDVAALAQRIHDAVTATGGLAGQHVRVNKP